MISDKFDLGSLERMGIDLRDYGSEEVRECLEIFKKEDFYLFPETEYGNRLLNDFMRKFREEMFAG